MMRVCDKLLDYLAEKYLYQEVKPVQHPFGKYVENYVENVESMSNKVELRPIPVRGAKTIDK